MINVIKKSDLKSYIIHEGCDKGCGYIDERDLDSIHVFNTYTQDEVIDMLTELRTEIEELQGKYSPYYDEASQHTSELIQQKIDKLRGEIKK